MKYYCVYRKPSVGHSSSSFQLPTRSSFRQHILGYLLSLQRISSRMRMLSFSSLEFHEILSPQVVGFHSQYVDFPGLQLNPQLFWSWPGHCTLCLLIFVNFRQNDGRQWIFDTYLQLSASELSIVFQMSEISNMQLYVQMKNSDNDFSRGQTI